MHLDGSQAEILTSDLGYIDFQEYIPPHRDWIFWISLDGYIYRMRLDGSQKKNLTPSLNWSSNLALSPDNQWIVFGASNQNAEIGIYRMRLDGSDKKRLVKVPYFGSRITWTFANLPPIAVHREVLMGVGAVLMLGAVGAWRFANK